VAEPFGRSRPVDAWVASEGGNRQLAKVLPDFPEFKEKLERRLLLRFEQKRTSELGSLGEAPAFMLQEGKRLIFVNEDGGEREMEFKRAAAEFSVSTTELPTLTLDQLVAKIERAAGNIAKQQYEHAINELSSTIDAIGSRLDVRGEPLAPGHVLEMLERISIEAGEPQLPTIVIHPDQASRAEEVVARIQVEPALQERYAQIVSEKRKEWRARESRRKLVG
jgi:hypothetical protein